MVEHWYIDNTWIYLKGYRQLIIILYLDKNSNKRFPGMFCLINNKKENSYILLFKKKNL